MVHGKVEPLPRLVRELLACPSCKGALVDGDGAEELLCTPCCLAYPIRGGIPVLLEAEARATVAS